MFLWPLVITLFGLVIYGQQSSNLGSRAKSTAAPVAVDPTVFEETVEEQTFAGVTRLFLKAAAAMKATDPSAPIGEFLPGLENQAKSPADKVRLVIAAGELKDETSALSRLATLESNAEIPPALKGDLATLRAIYEGRKADLTDDQRAALKKNHRKLGDIALTFKDGDTPERRALMAGGIQLLVLIIVAGLIVIGAFVSGFLLLPFMLVMFATRRLKTHFVPPAPGGSVFLETFAVFLVGFLVLKLVSGAIADANPTERWPLYLGLAAQWLLMPIVLWPRVRGMTSRAWSSAVGLHKGGGVGREILAGVVGYVSGLPILAVAMVVTAVLIIVRNALSGEKGPPNNPIQEFLQNSDLPLQLLLGLMAFAWAPIVEELIFRGGVYRHLRARTPILVAAAFSALIFGFMHGYDPIMLLPVIALGFNFALIREWRGSIIASMTAHAIHNGFIMASMIVGINLLG